MGEMWENLGDPRNLLMLNRRRVAFHQGARPGALMLGRGRVGAMGEMWENLGDPRNLFMLNRRQEAFHQGARPAHDESPWSSPLPNPPSSATEGPPLTVLLINFVSPHRTMIIADEFLFILS